MLKASRWIMVGAVAAVAAAAAGEERTATEPREAIAWFATWESGLEQAKRLNRPILLVSAAPHCHHTSGMW